MDNITDAFKDYTNYMLEYKPKKEKRRLTDKERLLHELQNNRNVPEQ